MFLNDCAGCGRRELFGPRRVDSLVTTERGIEVHYHCRACAAPNIMLTGRAGAATATATATATMVGRGTEGPSASPGSRDQPGAA